MPTWSIGYPERERIEIEVLSAPENDRREDWIRARVRLDVGGFRGDFEMMMLGSELQLFREALALVYRDLRGVAEFQTIEGQLRFKVDVDKLGHVSVLGYANDDVSFRNRLSFELRFDQTLLRHTISELDDAILELRKRT
jgi:hypothetical protein